MCVREYDNFRNKMPGTALTFMPEDDWVREEVRKRW